MAAAVAAGAPRTVWLRGEAGIGKTALARRALTECRHRFTVLDAIGDPAESVLDFGIVEQVVRGVDPAVRCGASLLARPVPPGASPFAVGAELLGLLAALQADRPVAVLLDDVHWADIPSARAFGFVLRRIWADQVLIVLVSPVGAEHEPESPLYLLERSCPEAAAIELRGLRPAEVGELSVAVTGHPLSARAAERLHSHTGGNPLHVRTLLHELDPDAVDDEQRALPAPRSLVAAVRSTLERLPTPARALTEALAVLDDAVPAGQAGVVAGIEDVADVIGPVIDSGLVVRVSREPAGRLAISHRLHREAVYDLIPPRWRAELHRRAIEVADPVSRWAHRVAAAPAADWGLAAELETAAEEAGACGQHTAAARYLRWAAHLSDRRPDYERRLLVSCVHTLLGPDRNAVLTLEPDIQRCAGSALRALTLGLVALFAVGDPATAGRHLSAALAQCRDRGWVAAVAAAGLAGATMCRGAAEETIRLARLALGTGGLPARLADVVVVFLAVARCRADGMAQGLTELDHLAPDPAEVPPEQLDSLSCRGAIRTMLGHFPEAEHDLGTVVRRHRAGHHLMSGTAPHSYLAALHYVRGDWEDAAVLVHQARSLADPDEQPHHRVLRDMVASLVPSGRGQWAVATAHVNTAWATTNRIAGPQDVRYAVIAEATLHQARGRPADMLTALRKITHDETARNGTHRWWELWWRPLIIEALLGTGSRAEAAEHFAELRRHAATVEYLAPTILRFDIALSGSGGPARTAERIAALAATAPRHSFVQAQLEAGYGRWLAATGRPADAARHLTTARDRYHSIGATPFADRVSTVLARCAPAPVEPAAQAVVPGLSRRESQIAHLVRLNQTNREIAARLYITPKTVEYHLSNVYSKLGIPNRQALRDLIRRSCAE